MIVVLLTTSSVVEAGPRRPRSWQRDCEAFAGVFHEIGRFDPARPIGEPVPERGGSSNFRFVGTDLLRCSPECTWKVDSRETSFAFRYDTSAEVLRWAAVTSPEGRELARGELSMRCEEGKVFTSGVTAGATGYFVGRSRDTHALVIDERGWLVSFSRSAGFGLAWGVVPVAGASTQLRMEFPPDVESGLDATALLARPSAIPAVELDPATEPVTEAPAPVPEPPPWPGPTRLRLIAGHPVSVGTIELTLERAGYDHGPGEANHSSARLVARQGEDELILTLERDHAAEAVFAPLFDHEIALEVAVPHAVPSLALVHLR